MFFFFGLCSTPVQLGQNFLMRAVTLEGWEETGVRGAEAEEQVEEAEEHQEDQEEEAEEQQADQVEEPEEQQEEEEQDLLQLVQRTGRELLSYLMPGQQSYRQSCNNWLWEKEMKSFRWSLHVSQEFCWM